MGQPQTAAIVLAASSGTAVCASQTPSAAGPLVINGVNASGGVATLDAARRIIVVTTVGDPTRTLTLQGTDRGGNPIMEVLVLTSGANTFQSLQDFKTVASAVISAAATAGPMTVGTSGTASTRWIKLDTNRDWFTANAAVNFGGVTANATLEGTLDPFDKAAVDSAPGGNSDSSAAGLVTSTFVPPIPIALRAASASDVVFNIITPIIAVRLTVNSGGASAGVRLTVVQQGS